MIFDYCKISYLKFLGIKLYLGLLCLKYKGKENLNEIIGCYVCELGCFSFLFWFDIFGESLELCR